MKTLDLFIVEIESQTKDTIVTDGGLELYIDTKFNEFEHRTTDGPIVAAPSKYKTGASVGDTLYFHHLVVLNEGQTLTGLDKNYTVRYDPKETINNQAIAYKDQETGRIHPLAGWVLLEHVDEEEEVLSEVIEVVKLKEKPVIKGRVGFDAPWVEELGLKKGDVVGFKKGINYKIDIDGVNYYRLRAEDLLYVEA